MILPCNYPPAIMRGIALEKGIAKKGHWHCTVSARTDCRAVDEHRQCVLTLGLPASLTLVWTLCTLCLCRTCTTEHSQDEHMYIIHVNVQQCLVGMSGQAVSIKNNALNLI